MVRYPLGPVSPRRIGSHGINGFLIGHDASLVSVPATLRRDKFPLIEDHDAGADVACPLECPLEVLFRLSDAGGQ